jgi:hypothetical protein
MNRVLAVAGPTPQTNPRVALGPEPEVARLIDAALTPVHRVVLMTLYATGLLHTAAVPALSGDTKGKVESARRNFLCGLQGRDPGPFAASLDDDQHPRAMTCCLFSSLKTLLTATEGNDPRLAVSRVLFELGLFLPSGL